MSESLRQRLIGAWRLVRYVERPVNGSPAREPMTENPQGLILYTADGYMSAQLCTPGRQPFPSNDWFIGSAEDFRAEATSYIAYSGPWEVGPEPGTLIHGMDVSLFPNWNDQRQIRKVHVDGDRLVLRSQAPVHSGGTLVDAELEWRRASPWPARTPS